MLVAWAPDLAEVDTCHLSLQELAVLFLKERLIVESGHYGQTNVALHPETTVWRAWLEWANRPCHFYPSQLLAEVEYRLH
jgi:hypothetical protein